MSVKIYRVTIRDKLTIKLTNYITSDRRQDPSP